MENQKTGLEVDNDDIQDLLRAQKTEIESAEDLKQQKGTPIPALFNQFFKFIQNPSTVSVETFKRMVDTDDTIGSGVDFLATCLAARMGQYQHKNPKITKFVNDALEQVSGGWYNAIKELLSASWVGFAVQEKVWANDDMGFIVKELITLPPSTILFETDRTGKLTEDGILQYQRNYNPHMMGQGLGFFGANLGMTYGFSDGSVRPDSYAKLGDFPYPIRTANTYNYLSLRIPRVKCIHYSFDAQGKFGNPYGRSLLRRAYKYYVLKDAFLQMLSIALDRKGTPLTIVYADPNTTLQDAKKFNANAPVNERAKVRADQAAQKAFSNVHNDSVIVLPGKKGQIFEVDMQSAVASTDGFERAIDLCNKSILRALLIPSLIFANGDGTGSFALGQEHSKTFDKILDGMLVGVQEAYKNQLIRELIAYNFPESEWKKDGLGSFSKRTMTKEEVQKEAEVFDKGINMGVIDVNDINDLNKMRETLGFEPRETPIEKPGLSEDGGQNFDAFGGGGDNEEE